MKLKPKYHDGVCDDCGASKAECQAFGECGEFYRAEEERLRELDEERRVDAAIDDWRGANVD